VILADDEEDVIQVIMRKIPWEELGYQTPLYAHNGLEALELAEEFRPDVLMTDIKMPYLDGLELSRRMKEMYPDIRIIIFSGFNEFEYAKEAVHLEAQEYLLKPMDFEELQKVFRRVKESLDRSRTEQRNVRQLREYYLQSLPLLQENFYASLVQGKVRENEIDQYVRGYQIDLKGPYFCIAILHASVSLKPEGLDITLMDISVRQSAEKRIPQKYRCRYFSYLGNTVVIAQFYEKDDIIGFTDALDGFCRYVQMAAGIYVTAGIGQLVDGMLGLSESYAGARNAVSYRTLYGRGKAINITEIDPNASVDTIEDAENGLKPIFKRIKIEPDEPLDRLIDSYIESKQESFTSLQTYHLFVMDLVAELYRFARSNELDLKEVFGSSDSVYNDVREMAPDQLAEWLRTIAARMRDMLGEKRQDSTRSFVHKAQEYVKDHYDEQDLSVTVLCDYLGVSAAYFSTVFKRETGKSFTTYLTDFRMEKAVQMLTEQNAKTSVIARRVGYADPNYFSYVFRKQFGMPPSKYKAREGGQ
ncbi:MAG: response regulator, partial [Solobacterium sp.]|nr:response regulator [Solobacterium sp.]